MPNNNSDIKIIIVMRLKRNTKPKQHRIRKIISLKRPLHIEKSLLVWFIFWINQTEFHLFSNKSENSEYNLISVWFTIIRFSCIICIKLYLRFSNWSVTKRNFIWFQINWKMVIKIWFRFDLTRFKRYFSVPVSTKSWSKMISSVQKNNWVGFCFIKAVYKVLSISLKRFHFESCGNLLIRHSYSTFSPVVANVHFQII